MPKLNQVIIKELKEQRDEYKTIIKDSKAGGMENMNHTECEDYGYYVGAVSTINQILNRYK